MQAIITSVSKVFTFLKQCNDFITHCTKLVMIPFQITTGSVKTDTFHIFYKIIYRFRKTVT